MEGVDVRLGVWSRLESRGDIVHEWKRGLSLSLSALSCGEKLSDNKQLAFLAALQEIEVEAPFPVVMRSNIPSIPNHAVKRYSLSISLSVDTSRVRGLRVDGAFLDAA